MTTAERLRALREGASSEFACRQGMDWMPPSALKALRLAWLLFDVSEEIAAVLEAYENHRGDPDWIAGRVGYLRHTLATALDRMENADGEG